MFHSFISISAAPREGAYVHGMFMEGARWDTQSGIIVESRLKELFPAMPVINVRVIQFTNLKQKQIILLLPLPSGTETSKSVLF